MNYIKIALRWQSQGSVVIVTLIGVESDVFLVDQPNLSAFESGASFHYHGGHVKSSPVRIAVPTTGDWTVVVIPGAGGAVQAEARVIPAS
jgi:hypothetical protein